MERKMYLGFQMENEMCWEDWKCTGSKTADRFWWELEIQMEIERETRSEKRWELCSGCQMENEMCWELCSGCQMENEMCWELCLGCQMENEMCWELCSGCQMERKMYLGFQMENEMCWEDWKCSGSKTADRFWWELEIQMEIERETRSEK